MLVDYQENNKKIKLPVSRRTGLVLIFVLWVLVILAIMVVALAWDTRLDSAVRLAAADRVTARWLTRAGVGRAIGAIAADHNQNDGPHDSWFDNEEVFHQVPLPGGSYTVFADRFLENNRSAYGVIDEASRLNLNTATREMLLALPNMTAAAADQIIEFRHRRSDLLNSPDQLIPDDFPPAQSTTPAGFLTIREIGLLEQMTETLLRGEDTNFNGILENQENDGAYLPPFDNQDRVLDRGVLSYVTVYSKDYNRNAAGAKRLNVNTISRAVLQEQLGLHACYVNWIMKNRDFHGIGELLKETVDKTDTDPGLLEDPENSVPPDVATFRRIADLISVTDREVIPGRININTASEAVLLTLPEMNQALARNIIESQPRQTGYVSVADLLKLDEVAIEPFIKIAPLITVRSNVFTVRCQGAAERTGLKHLIEAVVARTPDGVSVLYWKESR